MSLELEHAHLMKFHSGLSCVPFTATFDQPVFFRLNGKQTGHPTNSHDKMATLLVDISAGTTSLLHGQGYNYNLPVNIALHKKKMKKCLCYPPSYPRFINILRKFTLK